MGHLPTAAGRGATLAGLALAALLLVACGDDGARRGAGAAGADGSGSADARRASVSGTDAPDPATPPRHLLLVTFDTTRADRIGAYGHAGAATPTLDRLAAGGLLFERAWAPTPITLPSHATLLTGLPPAAHGVHNNGAYSLPPEAETLAEALGGHGFTTAAFVSAFVLDRRFGLDQGFDHYGDDLTVGYATINDLEVRSRSAERTVDEAVAWLQERAGGGPGSAGDQRFFLWLHLFDPHMPYRLEDELAARFAADPYDGEIHRADREVGRLLTTLDRLGLADDTLVVATADHGESLGEHGEDTHGLFIYDSTLRVPLILHHPGSLPAGRRSTDNAGLVDVAPTVLDLLRIEPPETMAGRSLLDPLDAAEEGPPPLLIESALPAESYGWSPLAGVVDGDHKYIAAPRPEVYDLARDPDESDNLWDGPDDETRRLSRRLVRAHRDALAALTPLGGAGRDVDAEEARALRSLGYVARAGGGDGRGAAAADGELRDPKAMVGFVDRLKRASSLVAERRFGAARPLLEEMLADDPGSYDALWMLGEVERQAGDLEGAAGLFERATEVRPDGGQAWVGLGKIAAARGDAAGARELFERATADPESDDAHLNLAVAWLDAGRPPRALEVLQAAAERFPYSPQIPYLTALVLEGQGRTGDAGRQVARALELRPDYPAARELRARLAGGAG